jgi:hypothetical protein
MRRVVGEVVVLDSVSSGLSVGLGLGDVIGIGIYRGRRGGKKQ